MLNGQWRLKKMQNVPQTLVAPQSSSGTARCWESPAPHHSLRRQLTDLPPTHWAPLVTLLVSKSFPKCPCSTANTPLLIRDVPTGSGGEYRAWNFKSQYFMTQDRGF